MSAGRIFTLEEANRTLPYVRRIAADLVRDYREWQETLAQYDLAAARRRAAADGATVDDSEATALEKRATALAGAIEIYLAEIAAVGAEVKGFGEGLIDFPGELDGRAIRWCWMLGEPAIEHWHDSDSNFAGRQPITALATTGGER
ncbi:MAG TPA: DUF2203 domain-containing protein [Gemmatimonadaceae bacterium]|nr:DUF2203 domain-containing protein [Gemmatimonadaceae bacterium]